ncbi:MAG: hypothetical protein AAGL49_03080, partial [Pseudomonadota bacterium]
MRFADGPGGLAASGRTSENLEGAHAAMAMAGVFIVFLCLFSAALTAALLPDPQARPSIAATSAPEPVLARFVEPDAARAPAPRSPEPNTAPSLPLEPSVLSDAPSVSAPPVSAPSVAAAPAPAPQAEPELRSTDLTALAAIAASDPGRLDPSLARLRPLSLDERRFALAFSEDVGNGVAEHEVDVGSGQTLADVIASAGVARPEAERAVAALQDAFDPRSLRAGDRVQMTTADPALSLAQIAAFGENVPRARLASLHLRPDPETRVVLQRTEAGFIGREEAVKLAPKKERARGVIDSSLYLAALDAGMPDAMIVQFMNVFTYDIDFQRQIRAGDSFDAVFSRLYDEDGRPVKADDLLMAEMTVGGAPKAYYRFMTPDDGRTDYYDADGRSAQKFLMKTPISGARLSSGFGKRVHPVLGYTKAHKGVDFAAKTG